MNKNTSSSALSLAFILASSTALKFFYVFKLTEWPKYLTTDMQGYFNRASMRFAGEDTIVDQWGTNAPFFHRLLAEYFSALHYFGLYDQRHAAILCANILLSTLAVYALYRIAQYISGSNRCATVVAALYAFSFPVIYLNTFVLAEPFGIPLVIFSIFLLFKFQNSPWIVLCGLSLGLGVGIRPSNGLIALPFGLYLLFHDGGIGALRTEFLRRIRQAALFSAPFLAIVFSICAENYRVSSGRLSGLTAHSGYNFYLGQAQLHRIISKFDGLTYGFVPSSVADKPELGTVVTNIPLYESERFFKAGWRILEKHPHLWWDHVKKYYYLLFDNMMPSVDSCYGFDPLFEWWRYGALFMLLCCGMLWLSFKDNRVSSSKLAVIVSIFALCAAPLYFFTVTHQYFYNFAYTVYLGFVIALFSSLKLYSEQKTGVQRYWACIILLFSAYYLWDYAEKTNRPLTTKVTVTTSTTWVTHLDQAPSFPSRFIFNVDRVDFPFKPTLTHATFGDLGFRENFFLEAVTIFKVVEAGWFQFFIASDDGYRAEINDTLIAEEPGFRKDLSNIEHRKAWLEPGSYTIRLKNFQRNGATGLVAFYQFSKEEPKAPQKLDEWIPKFGETYRIGQSSPYAKFSLPTATR